MTEVAQGTSLARFGDGELAIMIGKDAKYQKYNRRLKNELRRIMKNSPCLVGVPHTRGERGWQWMRFLERYGEFIKLDGWYGSSLVSRDDEVPWTDEYRTLLSSLWEGRNITLLAAAQISLHGAGAVKFVKVPEQNAFDEVDRLQHDAGGIFHPDAPLAPDLAILSCGPTATVLADRLTRKGIWAVDLGNFAKFL